jgi:hypothetical protein
MCKLCKFPVDNKPFKKLELLSDTDILDKLADTDCKFTLTDSTDGVEYSTKIYLGKTSNGAYSFYESPRTTPRNAAGFSHNECAIHFTEDYKRLKITLGPLFKMILTEEEYIYNFKD